MSPTNGKLPSATSSKVVVATTVALSFISFWRGASIVLSDLASSAFYAGGAAEQAIGKAAPWFVIGVMLFSFAVRSIYLESCSMYVRGGVYVVVRDSMGPVMAKLSVSALVFDYILTGPISGVSAGQYLGALINELTKYHVNVDLFAAGVAVLATVYFWWMNIKGVHESSGKALRIMQITTVMVAILLIWCPITMVLQNKWKLPPAPIPSNIMFSEDAQGWLKGTFWLQWPVVMIIIAFGHSLLSMSGFETLAQVYREIASPKLKNLKIAANIVCVYALIGTGIITLVRRHDHSRWRAAQILRQLDRRAGDEFERPLCHAAGVPHLRGVRGRADSFRRDQHVDHRSQWRAEPGGRGRRPGALVPASPAQVRNHPSHH